MTKNSSFLNRDGTSQADRTQAALDPSYVSVDERSIKDLLAFAKAYAKELRYFGVEDGNLKAMGDWSAFLDMNLDDVIAYLEFPEYFSDEEAAQHARPHVVLFLAFLKLLKRTQGQLNTLTQRHLDFYYREILQMMTKAGIPDRLNVLVDLAPDTQQFLLPEGTRLNAGPDSQGQDLIYETDADIVINRAQVAKLSSVFAEKRVIGIREARELHDGPKNEAVLRMFEVAFGRPLSGDPLPLYQTREVVDYEFLLKQQRIANFVTLDLSMDYSVYRDLIDLKQQRGADASEWARINQILEGAGKERTGNDAYTLNPSNPKDFDANLLAALDLAGLDPADENSLEQMFNGVTEVETIYDAYDKRNRTDLKADIEARVKSRMYMSFESFAEMMYIKVSLVDSQWEEINRILQEAGARKGTLSDIFPARTQEQEDVFETNLKAALGANVYDPLDGISNLKDYHDAYLRIESYFFMTAQDFAYVMSVAENQDSTQQEWSNVYSIMAGAHEEKVYADRRETLRQIRLDETVSDGIQQGFEAAVAYALGDQYDSSQSMVQQMLEYLNEPDDLFLLDFEQRIETESFVSQEEYNELDRVLENGMRVRENLPAPIAQKEEWLNLYATEDATTLKVELGIEGEGDDPRWKTFGEGQPNVKPDEIPSTEFGWGISSPILLLNEGDRKIVLLLAYDPENFDAEKISALLPAPSDPSDAPKKNPFVVQVSTEKGWVEPDDMAISLIQYFEQPETRNREAEPVPGLRLELTFGSSIDPIVAPPVDESQMQVDWPVLRLVLKHEWQPDLVTPSEGRYITHYKPFEELILLRAFINVDVTGLLPSQMQNDENQIAPTKPFEPFTTRPASGSRLLLSHPEFVIKKLDSVDFNLEWMSVADDIKGHYANYKGQKTAYTDDFTVRVSMVDRRIDQALNTETSLFNSAKSSSPQKIPFEDVTASFKALDAGYRYKRAKEIVTGDDLLSWNRYIQWQLVKDFQHNSYTSIAANRSLELAAAIANKTESTTITAGDYQVNPPYTPKIKSLLIDYTSSLEIIMDDYSPGGQMDRIFHLQPFGYAEVMPETDRKQYLFMPPFDHEGELYIGIQGVAAPQNLSILFQMAEGSANPDLEPDPIKWSYLSGNRWLTLEDGHILEDTTRGFINSGIVKLSLPAFRPNTLLASDLYWIRVAIGLNTDSVCDTVAVHTQAISATFADQGNAPDHLSGPLPVESISDLSEAMPDVSGVRQPYTSYGGKSAEDESTFYTRISERLRHKHRAVSMWDYERMILENFSEIYKAKCLPAAPDNPGQVDVIVIPDIREKLPFNPFEPKAPTDVLADIETFLEDNIPPFATVNVKNARYIPVKVRFAVRFRKGYNEGFYKQQLNDELNRFLSPWAYQEGADIVIGGRIYANVIINFIEERPYVDYAAEIKLFSSPDKKNFIMATPSPSDGYWVETEHPDEVLVAAREHVIQTIPDTGYQEDSFSGINYMKVELDFIVG